MTSVKFTFWAALTWGVIGGFIALSERRETYWRPVINGVAERSGNGPVKWMRALPFKGCGWSFGETIYGEFTVGGVPADFLMCRSRHGVRFDITTHESHWVRGGPAKSERTGA